MSMDAEQHELSLRVLVIALTSRDRELVQGVLADVGVHAEACRDVSDLVAETRRGAGALLVAEETLAASGLSALAPIIEQQPAWSDLAVLVLTRSGADSPIARLAVERLGNVTLLERPIRISALVSAVRSALRARQRQYQIRSYLREQESTQQALRELDQRKDEFLATLSHELRNPLAPLRNSLHLLRATTLDKPVEKVVDVMDRQVGHLERLVDDLLEVSRITRGRIELRREYTRVADIVESAIETSRPLVDAAGHALTVQMEADDAVVYADAMRLTQVLTNLLNNAVKYSDAGAHIRVSARVEAGSVRISVADNGIGIAPDVLPHVFDMFTQADRSLRRTQGGLGIGLTLVKKLMDMHDGSVHAMSAGLGEGSEFVIQLPLAEGEVIRRSGSEAASGAWSLEGLRAMVVDDNVDAAESIAAVLRAARADVFVAHDGQSALERIESFAPSVVLLDIGMPGLDGYAVAQRIRSNERLRGVLLIAVTGWGQADDRYRSRSAGFDYHLVKPLDLSQLREILGLIHPSAYRPELSAPRRFDSPAADAPEAFQER